IRISYIFALHTLSLSYIFLYLFSYCFISLLSYFFCFFNDPATTEIYTLSLHDALPIWSLHRRDLAEDAGRLVPLPADWTFGAARSEEHTSELQSRSDLVCRLLLEKKKKKDKTCTQ